MALVRCAQCSTMIDPNQPCKCGTTIAPLSPVRDVMIGVNWDELRVMAAMASNWAQSLSEERKLAFRTTLRRLDVQRPDSSYETLSGEDIPPVILPPMAPAAIRAATTLMQRVRSGGDPTKPTPMLVK
ncbi:MAG: hypothetical protein Q7R39_11500 [Dehalococcoidia bacterium]|nr:hypothetical protein [Dehalococcoidia bacterium]